MLTGYDRPNLWTKGVFRLSGKSWETTGDLTVCVDKNIVLETDASWDMTPMHASAS